MMSMMNRVPMYNKRKLNDFSDVLDLFEQLGVTTPHPPSSMHRLFCDSIVTKDHYKFVLDMPGFKKEDIKIDFQDNVMVVEGSRHDEVSDKKQGTFKRTMGEFKEQMVLDADADMENTKAHFKDGVLTIMVPRKSSPPPKKKIMID